MKKFTAVLLSIFLIFSLCACGSSDLSDKIIGKWTGTERFEDYEFFRDGTVERVYYYTDGGTKDRVGTYTILDGSRIKIQLDSSNIYDYSIKGKTLTLDGYEYIKE